MSICYLPTADIPATVGIIYKRISSDHGISADRTSPWINIR